MIDKNFLRKELLSRRDSIPIEVRNAKNKMICERLVSLSEFRNANVVLLYASFRTEVDTNEVIKEAIQNSRCIVLPKVDRINHVLKLYEIKKTDELIPGYRGISEPSINTEDRLFNINNVDIVIIPGAGFDLSGSRLGYGAGFYDILLSGLKKKLTIIAPAYEEQVVDLIPSETHDVKVQIIVTDRRIIRCAVAE